LAALSGFEVVNVAIHHFDGMSNLGPPSFVLFFGDIFGSALNLVIA
jgi:hypothetical protein